MNCEVSAKEKRENFYQAKYDYYQQFTTWVVIVSCLMSVTYFISDCQLFSEFAWDTLIPRTFILLPMVIYIIVDHKVTNYKIMVPLSYVMIHGIMWCTIWAIYYLPIRQHANEGFIIMHFMFFAMGFCAPFHYSTVAHLIVIANIIISNQFNHYENYDLMLSLAVPLIIGICLVNYVMEKVFRDQYTTKKELEQVLMLDQLTQAYNRNKMKNLCYPGTWRLKGCEASDTAFLMIDIDFFKKVNDTYGHDGGDIVLKHLVEILKQYVEKEDCIIRWGGEEFVVIMPKTSLKQAELRAESIRMAVETMDNPVCRTTVSIGVSQYDKKDYRVAVTCADKALYEAKAGGRNCVKVYKD